MKKPKAKKKPNPKKRVSRKRTPKKRATTKRVQRAVKSVRKSAAKRPASRPRRRKASTPRRNPRPRPSLIRALIPIEDMQALAKGAASDIEALSNPRKRIRTRRVTKGKRGAGTRRNPYQHVIIRRRRKTR